MSLLGLQLLYNIIIIIIIIIIVTYLIFVSLDICFIGLLS